MENSEAYRILTRELTNMYHTERSALDVSPKYQEILDNVKAGNVHKAVVAAISLRTESGNKWRAKQDLPFINILF